MCCWIIESLNLVVSFCNYRIIGNYYCTNRNLTFFKRFFSFFKCLLHKMI